MSYHVSKGMLTSDKLKNGALATLAGPSFKVVKDADGVELAHPLIELDEPEVDQDHADFVETLDLTFDGPWKKTKRNYVVHAVGRVMIPMSVADAARKARAEIEVSVLGAAREFPDETVYCCTSCM